MVILLNKKITLSDIKDKYHIFVNSKNTNFELKIYEEDSFYSGDISNGECNFGVAKSKKLETAIKNINKFLTFNLNKKELNK